METSGIFYDIQRKWFTTELIFNEEVLTLNLRLTCLSVLILAY